ncbi:MAG: T9SS type A sorting domain-containing protein [Cytophagaceae bacterium]|nr:MAG: T9SS type A sorting domain-containing protein [Cytophagaceae bacterium]
MVSLPSSVKVPSSLVVKRTSCPRCEPTAGTGTTVAVSASPYTLTGLQSGTLYDLYIRSVCSTTGTSTYAGPVSFNTLCSTTTSVATFPYRENFDTVLTGQSLPCGITVLDANADNVTWRVSTEYPNSGTRNIRYQSVTTTVAADDWFFTPALALPGTANTRYQVAFSYRAAGTGTTGTSNYTEALEVKSGTAATVAGQTNLLYTNNSINNLAYAQAGGSSTPVVAYLPAGASTQYVGFHVKSAALQGNLYIDDLSVTAITITGTSEALLRAVNVFPNPSATGIFNLQVSGANAQKGLEVEVTNNLGQRVYTGAARDNFTTQLDLSRLAAGLYHLKVKNGDEYLVRQLSIAK